MLEYVYIFISIPDTPPLEITEFIIVVMMVELDLGLKRLDTIPLEIMEFIILVKMLEVDPGLKISENLTLTIADKELMLMGEVNIGLIPATLLSTT